MHLTNHLQLAAQQSVKIENAIQSVFFCAGVVRNPGEKCALDEAGRIRQLLEAIDRLHDATEGRTA